jgi:hypothetical protein
VDVTSSELAEVRHRDRHLVRQLSVDRDRSRHELRAELSVVLLVAVPVDCAAYQLMSV